MAIDLPFIKPSTLQTLVAESYNFDVTAFRGGQFAEPLCAVYHKNVLQTVEKQISNGNYSLQKLLQSSNTNFLDLTQEMSLQFKNINTPDEYKAIANK
jgi:molybdopterin-guanine dinucleotide biosynthesis protein A